MKTPQFLRDMQAARRKVEIASGTRTDARFVGKVIADKRRQKAEKIVHREMRDRRSVLHVWQHGFFISCYN